MKPYLKVVAKVVIELLKSSPLTRVTTALAILLLIVSMVSCAQLERTDTPIEEVDCEEIWFLSPIDWLGCYFE